MAIFIIAVVDVVVVLLAVNFFIQGFKKGHTVAVVRASPKLRLPSKLPPSCPRAAPEVPPK